MGEARAERSEVRETIRWETDESEGRTEDKLGSAEPPDRISSNRTAGSSQDTDERVSCSFCFSTRDQSSNSRLISQLEPV